MVAENRTNTRPMHSPHDWQSVHENRKGYDNGLGDGHWHAELANQSADYRRPASGHLDLNEGHDRAAPVVRLKPDRWIGVGVVTHILPV